MEKNDNPSITLEEKKELEFYRSFIKSMNGAMYTLNLSPYYMDWITDNEALHKIIGLNSDGVLNIKEGIQDWLMDSPDFKESVTIPIEEFNNNPDIKWAGVYRVKDVHGTYQWIIYSAATLEKNEYGLPKRTAILALPLKYIFNTPETLKELQKYLSQQIYRKIIERLTERQLEILQLIGKGFTEKEIADKIIISPHTVRDHKKVILEKLSCRNTKELAKTAQKLGII